MKKIVLMSLLFLCGWISAGAVDLNKENRDPKYVESIVNRSQKIVDKLGLTDAKVAEDVCNVIANRYFELNDIYEIRDAKVKAVKESGLTGDAKNEALKAAENEKDAALYRSHFAFPASLSLFLNEEQIEAVKDGMTYGVVKVTYEATLDMIPSLKKKKRYKSMPGWWKRVSLPWMRKIQIRNMRLSASTKDVSTIIWPRGDII